jgi:hypothetical protein
MRMKLIAYLLVLCLTFSIGSALAQPTSSTTSYKEGIILISGNVTGNVTMNGEEYKYTGPALIVRDTNQNTEKIWLGVGNIGSPISGMVANGSLTPLKVNSKKDVSEKLNMTEGNFGFMVAEDFNCKMTNMENVVTPGQKVDFDLTGDKMGVFGTYKDIDKLVKSTTDSAQCNITQVFTFPVSI